MFYGSALLGSSLCVLVMVGTNGTLSLHYFPWERLLLDSWQVVNNELLIHCLYNKWGVSYIPLYCMWSHLAGVYQRVSDDLPPSGCFTLQQLSLDSLSFIIIIVSSSLYHSFCRTWAPSLTDCFHLFLSPATLIHCISFTPHTLANC